MVRSNKKIQEQMDLPDLDQVMKALDRNEDISKYNLSEDELKTILDEMNNQDKNEYYSDDDDTDNSEIMDDPVVQDAWEKYEETEDQILKAGNLPELDDHSKKMDEIYKKALESSQDIIDVGFNEPSANKGKIWEAAANILNTALSAADSKADKKLKGMRLRLEIARLERDKAKDQAKGNPNVIDGQSTVFMKRDELLKELEKQQNNSESENEE